MSKRKHDIKGTNHQEPPPKKRALSPSVKRVLSDNVLEIKTGNAIPTERNSTRKAGRQPEPSNFSIALLSGSQEKVLSRPTQVLVPSAPLPQSHYPIKAGSGSKLPPLPPIQDQKFAEMPFIHQGTLSKNYAAQETLASNYERLEFLGDAYLQLISSRVILPRYPNFPPGRLSQTRQLLVCNETLAEFSTSYAFDERAHLPKDIRQKQGSRDKGWIKTMGDIFEAYVAALITSDPQDGFRSAEEWLTQLWEPLLSRQVNTAIADPTAKQQLATKIMSKGIKVFYRDEEPPDKQNNQGQQTFHIGVSFTGWGYTDRHLGSGSGLNKNEAGYAAATNALQNPLVQELTAIKKKHDAKIKAEKEKEAAKNGTSTEIVPKIKSTV